MKKPSRKSVPSEAPEVAEDEILPEYDFSQG
jgi:hypothetical protein